MDYLASGRPFLSTDVPECRLYPQWIQIARTPMEAAAFLRETAVGAPGYCKSQVKFAASHTWGVRAKIMLQILSCVKTNTEHGGVATSVLT
jgi:hypothetical protein